MNLAQNLWHWVKSLRDICNPEGYDTIYKQDQTNAIDMKATYTIVINEQQRRVLNAALRAYISATPNGGEHTEDGDHVAGLLEDMLDMDGTVGPLRTSGTNFFID